MFDFKCRLDEILLPKRTRNDYYVIPVVVSFSYKGKLQKRYMQAVTSVAKEQLNAINAGDNVLIRIALKGIKKDGKCYNLDEIVNIEIC